MMAISTFQGTTLSSHPRPNSYLGYQCCKHHNQQGPRHMSLIANLKKQELSSTNPQLITVDSNTISSSQTTSFLEQILASTSSWDSSPNAHQRSSFQARSTANLRHRPAYQATESNSHTGQLTRPGRLTDQPWAKGYQRHELGRSQPGLSIATMTTTSK
jgi:hypothetical protein